MFARDVPTAQFLLDRGVPVNQQDNDGMYPLLHALIKERSHNNSGIQIAELLLENGADSSLTTDDGTSVKTYVQSPYKFRLIIVSYVAS